MKSLRVLKEKKAICYPFSFIVYNAKPVGHQVPNLSEVHLLLLLSFSQFGIRLQFLNHMLTLSHIFVGSRWVAYLYAAIGRF